MDPERRLRIPRVSPIGVSEVPDGYARSPRRYPTPMRAMAAAMLLALTTVVFVTTAQSLANYCLTSQASAPASWPSLPFADR